MTTIDIRAKRVAWALALTENTSIAPAGDEKALLDYYVQGVLSLEDVIELLEGKQAEQPVALTVARS